MTFEKDEFDAWRDNPITQAVMKYVQELADRAKAEWIAASWEQGVVDPVLRADLYSRSQIASDLVNLNYEDIEDEDDKPKRDQSDRVQGGDPAKAG